MHNIEEFLEEYNNLVIGDESTAYFRLTLAATEEPWGTFLAPVDDPQRLVTAVSNLGHDLPTGQHSIKLQAISSKSDTIRGQIAFVVEGRSAAAKHAAKEQIELAKATAMHVDTMNVQLKGMSIRLQESQERCRKAEERAGDSISDVYKMGDLVNGMILKQKVADFDVEERQQRMENMAEIAKTMAPILGQAVIIASAILEIKVKTWTKNAEREAEEAEEQAKIDREDRAEKRAQERAATNGKPVHADVSVKSERTN